MANPEHVEIVKQGAKAIAAWRAKNPDTRLYLSDANLNRATLRRANLSGADLSSASLVSADLIGGNLSGHMAQDAGDSEGALNLSLRAVTSSSAMTISPHSERL